MLGLDHLIVFQENPGFNYSNVSFCDTILYHLECLLEIHYKNTFHVINLQTI